MTRAAGYTCQRAVTVESDLATASSALPSRTTTSVRRDRTTGSRAFDLRCTRDVSVRSNTVTLDLAEGMRQRSQESSSSTRATWTVADNPFPGSRAIVPKDALSSDVIESADSL